MLIAVVDLLVAICSYRYVHMCVYVCWDVLIITLILAADLLN